MTKNATFWTIVKQKNATFWTLDHETMRVLAQLRDDSTILVIPRATFLARNVATPCHQPLLLLWIIASGSQLFFF